MMDHRVVLESWLLVLVDRFEIRVLSCHCRSSSIDRSSLGVVQRRSTQEGSIPNRIERSMSARRYGGTSLRTNREKD